MKRSILGFLTCLILVWTPGCGGKPSVKQLRVLAAGGDIEAQYQLGLHYAHGEGISVDIATAVGWYRKAAAQGHRDAQLALGRALATGTGVPKDLAAALYWYRQAAERGLRPAQLVLGTTLLQGTEIPTDPVGGVAWLKVAGATVAELEGLSFESIEAKLTPGQRAEVEQLVNEVSVRNPAR